MNNMSLKREQRYFSDHVFGEQKSQSEEEENEEMKMLLDETEG